MANSRYEPLLDVVTHEQAPPADPEGGGHRLPSRDPVACAFFCDVQQLGDITDRHGVHACTFLTACYGGGLAKTTGESGHLMPLYLEDFPPSTFSYPMAAVLTMIALDVEDKPINPASAAELIRHFVRLLIPHKHHGLLAVQGQPSWDKVERIQHELALAAHKHQLDELSQAYEVVDLIYRHSTRPPREKKPAETVEVDSFLRMVRYAKQLAPPRLAVVNGRSVDLLKFCKYCWRPATSAARVCLFHSVGKSGNVAAAAEYKQAQRLQRSFEALVNRLGTDAELSFHDSEFRAPVFFPALGANEWLAQFRPTLHQALAAEGLGSRTLAVLCRYLYDDEAVARQLIDRPQILTPVTLRAEAWMSAMQARPKWGGTRTPREALEVGNAQVGTRIDRAV